MRIRLLVSISALLGPLVTSAGVKDDFVEAVVNQCKLSKEEASSLATPGRTGTVVQFKLCSEQVIKVKDGCSVVCTKAGSKIGQ